MRMMVMNQLPAGTTLALAQFELEVNQTEPTGVPRRHAVAQTPSTVCFNILSAAVFPPAV